MRAHQLLLIFLPGLMFAPSCSDDEGGGVCEAGSPVYCRCRGGAAGTKYCNDAGSDYGVCQNNLGECTEIVEVTDDDASGPGPSAGGGPVGPGPGGGGSAQQGSGGGVSGCAHDPCDEGVALDSGCGSCATAVCDADSFCCDVEWDAMCVGEAESICSLDCGGGEIGLGALVISEIMNNPAAVNDDSGEWFEIYNASGESINLSGLRIYHQAGDAGAVHVIQASLQVPAGVYVVVGNNENFSSNGGILVDYGYGTDINLSNNTDYLALATAEDLLIDETSWDKANLNPNGKSRSLDPGSLNAASNDDDTNFCAAQSTIAGSEDRGTPGAANDICP